MGDIEVLEVLDKVFGANLDDVSNKGLTCLHFSTYRTNSLASFYYLRENQQRFNPNARDQNGGTGLHYALTSLEEKNMQAMISLGVDLNAQDIQGNTVLHLAIIRFIDDQDNYQVYKRVVK